MNRKGISCSLVLMLAAFCGCSSKPSADASKKAAKPLDKIQGKAQVLVESGGAMDSALNAGGSSSVYLWEGMHRYRLFLRSAADIAHGSEYVAEGIYAQKAIDELGDPDQGTNGYPLASSCAKVVKMAWSNLAFDEVDAQASVLRTRVQRYPARPIFLVARIRPATEAEINASGEPKKDVAAGEKDVKEVDVAWDKERTALTQGPLVQTAPLWDPKGGTVQCKVLINPQGKIDNLETGMQLCESVNWLDFHFQPTVQGGKPVKVRTEVEVHFDPRK